jgi:hypothetical protein
MSVKFSVIQGRSPAVAAFHPLRTQDVTSIGPGSALQTTPGGSQHWTSGELSRQLITTLLGGPARHAGIATPGLDAVGEHSGLTESPDALTAGVAYLLGGPVQVPPHMSITTSNTKEVTTVRGP